MNKEIKLSKTVSDYYFGKNSFSKLKSLVNLLPSGNNYNVFVIDIYFKNNNYLKLDFILSNDIVFYYDTKVEPSVDIINDYVKLIREKKEFTNPNAIIGIGGGCTLDVTKAISNLLTNPGLAQDYQGWDLLQNKGIYKIGVPTISGTGAEASRTCVMMNYEKNLKMGMNSQYSLFDVLILDPMLTKTVKRDQYFYSAMDTYIHCIESLNGKYRHQMTDSYSKEALRLCDEVFNSNDMMTYENREKIMIASFLGGSSIANTYVGLIHPFSAGLSVVFGYHHCYANCLVIDVMEEFYPDEHKIFRTYLDNQNIELPKNILSNIDDETYEHLYKSTIIHEKPLENALGSDFKSILTFEKVKSIFSKI